MMGGWPLFFIDHISNELSIFRIIRFFQKTKYSTPAPRQATYPLPFYRETFRENYRRWHSNQKAM